MPRFRRCRSRAAFFLAARSHDESFSEWPAEDSTLRHLCARASGRGDAIARDAITTSQAMLPMGFIIY